MTKFLYQDLVLKNYCSKKVQPQDSVSTDAKIISYYQDNIIGDVTVQFAH